jgi:hypothetical protein
VLLLPPVPFPLPIASVPLLGILFLWLLSVLCSKLGKSCLEPVVAKAALQLLESEFDLALFVLTERVLLLLDGDGFLVKFLHRVYRFAFGDTRDFNSHCLFPRSLPFGAIAGVPALFGPGEAEHKVFGECLAGFPGGWRLFFAEVEDLDVSVGLCGGVLLLPLLLLLLWCWCVDRPAGLVLQSTRLLGVVLLRPSRLGVYVDDVDWLLAIVPGRWARPVT